MTAATLLPPGLPTTSSSWILRGGKWVLSFLQPPKRNVVAEAVSTGFYEHKTLQELTHCATGIYILLSAPITHRLIAAGLVT